MSRWPATTRCKSRLSKDIGPLSAANIQRKLINHTFKVVQDFNQDNQIEIRLAISGIANKQAKRLGNQLGIKHVYDQGKGNLGLRMRRQLLQLQNSKEKKYNCNQPVLFIGSDLPSLCKLDLITAIEELKTQDLILGPSQDGGYWIIGFKSKLITPVLIWPFCDIPWGTDQVLSKTINQAHKAGIRPCLIRVQNDIDRIQDLSPWHA